MSLTVGSGPFGERPAGRFDFEPPERVLFVDPVPHRIRAVRGGETVVDSRRVRLAHETGKLPVYWFPAEDVKGVETQTRPEELFAGLVTVEWGAADEWFCEDEQIFGHPRDPYSRIDVYRTARHVRVVRDGEVLADTHRAKVLFETALPPRYYIPPEDVRMELLEPSSTKTRCAYKGSASYYSLRVGGRLVEDLVWTYPDPQHDAEPVRDLLCFFNERVDLELDGEPSQRPRTQWSRDDED
jgi:uncharacterized protein (DUF427 family)